MSEVISSSGKSTDHLHEEQTHDYIEYEAGLANLASVRDAGMITDEQYEKAVKVLKEKHPDAT